jgi:hypothetical protein
MQNTHLNIREKEPADDTTAISVVSERQDRHLNQLPGCNPSKKGAKKNEQGKRFIHGYHRTAPVQ